MKNSPAEQHRQITLAQYQGPLPPPEMVKQYKDLNVWNDVITIAREESDRQNKIIELQTRTRDAEILNSREILKQTSRNQISQIILSYLGFFVFVGLLITGIIFAANKDYWIGGILLTAGFAPILFKFCNIPVKK